MVEVTVLDEMVFSGIAFEEEQGKKPSELFRQFMDFYIHHLPLKDARAARRKWQRRRKRCLKLLELFCTLPFPGEDKEEAAYLMLCGLAVIELPGWWHLFQDNLPYLTVQ